jgi:hypothetical protein
MVAVTGPRLRQVRADRQGRQHAVELDLVRGWEKHECLYMTRPHDCEVPPVQRGDLGELQALGDRDHGSVDYPKRKIQVCLYQLRHTRHIMIH